MLNKVMLIGRLGADPELRFLSRGDAVCHLRLATDESYVDKDGHRVERTEWHNVSVFGKSAKSCQQHLHKGSTAYVEGRLSTRQWQDHKGQDHVSTDIRADRVLFLTRRDNEKTSQAPLTEQVSDGVHAMDDIPF